MLTVTQKTQRGNFTIIPGCYSVSLVVFPICASPGCILSAPRMIVLKVYPVVIHTKAFDLLKTVQGQ